MNWGCACDLLKDKGGAAMIIDFRNRPPYGKFKESFLFQQKAVDQYCVKFAVDHTEAAKQKSMELYEHEKLAAGIDVAVIQGTKTQNDDIEALIAMWPGKYYGFAALDLYDSWEGSSALIERYVGEGLCSGVSMIPSFADCLVDDERILPIYEKCQAEQIPVMIFSGGNSRTNYEENKPIHVDNVARLFPKLQVIVGHGCWPYVQEMCGVAYKRENIYLCPDLYMFRTPGYQDFVTAANWHLRERFLFASSYPQVPLDLMVKWYHTCGICPEVLDNIFYKNAAKILNITL